MSAISILSISKTSKSASVQTSATKGVQSHAPASVCLLTKDPAANSCDTVIGQRPAHADVKDQLAVGTEVRIVAVFEGTRYTAESINVTKQPEEKQ